MTADEFWWHNITGPNKFISNVLDVLNQNKVALLEVPSDLSWRHTMRGEIEARFRDVESADIVIESVDAKDDIGNEDPGTFLLQKYAAFDEEIRDGFRETKNNNIQQYIKKNNVLKNRIIWIKGLSANDAQTWITFCEKYKINDITDGSFILEIQGKVKKTDLSNIQIIPYKEYVTQYDVQLFNLQYLNDLNNYSNGWKTYISELCAQLCDTDAEISKSLIDLGNFDKTTPEELIERIADSDEFSRRGADSEHILAIVRHKNNKKIQNRIWRAQMQVFFPIIEFNRVNLIEKWFDEIQNSLMNENVKQYGVQIYDPYEVELGTLYYLTIHKIDADKFKLYIPDQADRNKINFLHTCRNQLAHMKCCSPEQIENLITLQS